MGAVAYRAQVPPGASTSNGALSGKIFDPRRKKTALSGKLFYLRRKKCQPTQKISDDFFLVIHPQSKNFTFTELCRPLCRPLLTCAAPNFQLFSPFLHKVSPSLT